MKPISRVAYLCFFAVLWPVAAGAIVASVIDKHEIYQDARFIGTAVILSGTSVTTKDGGHDVCGASYTAFVTGSVLGPSTGSTIRLHVLKDFREEMRLGFLEVGSEYFVFAGDRKSHGFIQLTDVYSQVIKSPEQCHADDDAFYVFREFSGRLERQNGDQVLTNHYIRQIDGVNELRSYYWSEDEVDYLFGSKTKHEQLIEELHFVAVPVSSLFGYFGALSTAKK